MEVVAAIPPCPNADPYLSSDVFGGVLAIVVIATNIISIILTWAIMNKRLKDAKKHSSVEAAAIVRNRHIRDLNEAGRREGIVRVDELSLDEEAEHTFIQTNNLHSSLNSVIDPIYDSREEISDPSIIQNESSQLTNQTYSNCENEITQTNRQASPHQNNTITTHNVGKENYWLPIVPTVPSESSLSFPSNKYATTSVSRNTESSGEKENTFENVASVITSPARNRQEKYASAIRNFLPN